jgi:putative flavoprotein involved in K+ transport
VKTADVVVIGAGHAGLSTSYCLAERSIEHVVLERGEVAQSWRSERWDSLTLLTPNWQSRLPGFAYQGDDPDGYMAMPELIRFIDAYADAINAPVKTGVEVTLVRPNSSGFEVVTGDGIWKCRSVVLARGACNVPAVPAVASDLPAELVSVTTHQYRNPAQLPAGKVLVVGASATGLQLADEIQRSGHEVVLAVGEHVRLPRVYRGRDIQWWMHVAGILDEGLADVDDVNRARNLPSPQLVGSRARRILDLNAMSDAGVRLIGRLMAVRDGVAMFSGSLRNVCALADLKMDRLLDTIDEWAAASDRAESFEPPERFAATRVEASPPLTLDLAKEGVTAIVWATGYRPDYSWLQLAVLDRKGRLIHDEGVLSAPGIYALGLPFLRKRKSSFIHGTEDDARHVVGHLANYLGATDVVQ